MNIDFTNVQSGFKTAAPGDYLAIIKSCELKTNKAGDGQYLNFTYEILDEGEAKDVKIWDICSLKPAALWRLKGVMNNLGFDVAGEIDVVPEDFIGLEAVITVAMDTYEGKEKNVIKEIKKA